MYKIQPFKSILWWGSDKIFSGRSKNNSNGSIFIFLQTNNSLFFPLESSLHRTSNFPHKQWLSYGEKDESYFHFILYWKMSLTYAVMPTHPHQMGVIRILTSSPACQNSCLFTRISTLQAGSKISQSTLPKVVIKSIDMMTLNFCNGGKDPGLRMDVL